MRRLKKKRNNQSSFLIPDKARRKPALISTPPDKGRSLFRSLTENWSQACSLLFLYRSRPEEEAI
jgi:hypothetical protein